MTALLEEALNIYRQLGDEGGVARALWGLGQAQYRLKDFGLAAETLDQAIAGFRRLKDNFGLGWALFLRASTGLRMQDTATAKRHDLDALRIFAHADDVSGVMLVLSGLAAVARAEGDVERALRLTGASEAQEAATGTGLGSIVGAYEGWRPSEGLTPAEEALRAEGKAMTVEQAIEYALSADPDHDHLVGRV